MDKYEYKIRADEIKELIAEGDYQQAAEIADTIDWRRVKSVMMLCTISDLYKINRRYEDAKNMLLLAYERRPGGKTICYSLCELCIKTEEFLQAVNYYKEFVQVAPKDSGRYILQYKLYEAQDVGLEERISVLEELKKRDYREKWAYELAYLYHRVGLATRCVEECDELILWFGEGKYVIKAMELKMLHQPLSASQQEKYDHRFDPVKAPVQEALERRTTAARVQSGRAAKAQNEWAGSGQAVDAQTGWGMPMQDAEAGQEGRRNPAAGQMQDAEPGPIVQSGADSRVQVVEGVYSGWETQGTVVSSDTRTDWVLSTPEPVVQNTAFAAAAEQPVPEEVDIQVKTVDVGAYNTINLQAEIAAGLQEVLAEDMTQTDAITRSIIAPLLDSDTESLDLPEIDEVEENDLEPESEIMESSEVFFGETGELGSIQKDKLPVPEELTAEVPVSGKSASEQFVNEEPMPEESVSEQPVNEEPVSEKPAPEKAVPAGMEELHADETAKIVMDQLRMENLIRREAQVLTAQPPKELAGVLSQESDGQISLVVPESEAIEKQITGQMNLEDVLGEWEKLKRETEAKRQEEVRQHVLQQTGNMFTEFEESVRDGLLEQLESESIEAGEEAPEPEEIAPEEGSAEPEESENSEESEAGELEEESEEEPAEEFEEASAGEFEKEPEEELAEESEEASEGDPAEEPEGEPEGASGEEPEEEPEEASAEEPEGEPEGVSEKEPEGASEGEAEEALEEEPAEESEKASEETENTSSSARRENAKLRALTREEKELFAPFIQSRSGREQLVKAIDSISMAAYMGNVIITGEKGMDTLSLAKNMVREIQMTDSNFSGKVAKISGQGLNSKNVEETLLHLASGALIVQEASEMEKSTIEVLQKVLQKENFGIIIFLEDTKKAMEKMLGKYPKLRESFTARMDVEAMSNDSLVAFGRHYAKEMEYSIDDLGVLALHTRIEERQTLDHVVTVMEVKDIVDEAIRHVNRKTLGHFFDILFARRYDGEDMIILTEKDFG